VKKNNVGILIALLSVTFFSTCYVQISAPVLATMAGALNLTDPTLIGLIVTLPALMFIPSSLLCGKLSETVSKKILLYIGGTLFLIGGIGTIFLTDITTILVFRAILGFGTGICTTLATGFIPDYYEGKKRDTMIGVAAAFMCLFGFVLANLSGIMGSYGWQTSYWLHAVGVIPLILVLFLLPNKPTVVQNTNITEGKETVVPMKKVVYVYCISMFLLYTLMMVLWTQLSIFIEEEQFGSVAAAGFAGSLITLFSFIASMLFGKIFGIFKQFSLFISIAIVVAAFFIFANATNFTMVLIGVALCGFAMGLLGPIMLTKAVMAAPLQRQTFAVSLIIVGISGGQFGSSFWLQLVRSMTGDTSLRFVFILNGVLLAVAAVIALLTAIRSSKSEKSSASV